MSEPMSLEPKGGIDQPAAGATAGSLIRQAREAVGMSLASLAVTLKVPPRKLEALEADDWTQLPDATFVRALASSVCRTLKVDAAPILDRLPQVTAVLPDREEGLNTPFRPGRSGLGLLSAGSLPGKTLWIAIGLLLAGAGALLLFPYLRPAGTPAAPTGAAGEAPQVQMAVPIPVASEARPVAAAVAPPAAVASSPAVLLPVPSPGALPVGTVTLPAASAATAPAAPVEVEFTATAASWIKVTDAKGTVLLGRSVQPGEVVKVGGNPPLTTVIGKAEVTRVRVRGEPFDLLPHTRDSVARFEVK